MNDFGTHLVLFLAISLAIVALGTFYSESDDARALRLFPRRLLTFILGCGAVVVVMLICEHTFAAID